MTLIKRGEVFWVEFSNSVAGEVQKTRPAVIVSNNISNELLNRVQVIPLTSKVAKVYPCEVCIFVNGEKSKAMTDQIMTVSKERLKKRIAIISDSDMQAIERAIKLQLSIT